MALPEKPLTDNPAPALRPKGGRPRKPAYLKKTAAVGFRPSAPQRQRLERTAEQLGFARVSDFVAYAVDQILNLAEGGALNAPEPALRADPALITQLQKIGTNLNQAVRKLNRLDPDLPDAHAVNLALADLAGPLAEIRALLAAEFQK